MILQLGETVRRGQALDCRATPVEARRLGRAVRDETDSLLVAAPPGPVHDHVGVLQPEMDLDRQAALVAAARSLGFVPPQREAIRSLDAEIEAIEPDSVDLAAHRRRVAETGQNLRSLREAVARTSGRLAERRAADRPADDLESELASLTRELSEAETAAIAAREALEQAQRRAGAERDERARRLSLVDRRENRRREARRWLRERIAEAFERAVQALPVADDPAPPAAFDGPDFVAGLAIARIADVDAPIVIAEGPFETAISARAALDAPVVLARV